MHLTNSTSPKNSTNPKKLLVLILLFLIPSFFIFSNSKDEIIDKKLKLSDALAHINGYSLVESSPLEKSVFDFLDLDDYVFNTYEKDGIRITLYIGYYYTSEKVSSAHSPLACFPGQGWVITEPEYGTQIVGNYSINYAQIEASLEKQKELITYWYQSHDDTTPHIYRNKLNNFYNNLFNGYQQHAFVRISVPLHNNDKKIIQKSIENFSNVFYPKFIDLINSRTYF